MENTKLVLKVHSDILAGGPEYALIELPEDYLKNLIKNISLVADLKKQDDNTIYLSKRDNSPDLFLYNDEIEITFGDTIKISDEEYKNLKKTGHLIHKSEARACYYYNYVFYKGYVEDTDVEWFTSEIKLEYLIGLLKFSNNITHVIGLFDGFGHGFGYNGNGSGYVYLYGDNNGDGSGEGNAYAYLQDNFATRSGYGHGAVSNTLRMRTR